MHPLSRILLLVTLLTLTFTGSAQQSATTVPSLIRYGGVLKDARGAAMASRTVGITFLIYGQQDGGAPVWLETQNVATDAAGQYSVLLGSTTATGLPSDLFAQQEQRWLAVKAEGQPEQPRVLLVSVPYAMKAAEADRLAGHSVSEFVTTDNLQSAVQQQLQGQAATVPAGAPAGANGQSTAAGLAPVPTNPATNFVDTTTNQVVQVTQNGTGFGLNASASTPTGVGVLGTVSSSPKAGISAGVEGTSSINNGFGMFGYSTATSLGVGVQGRSDSPNGTGVRGWTTGTSGIAVNATSNASSGSPVGLYASVSAPNGTGALITNIASGTITGPLINATANNVTQFAVGATGNVNATGWLSGKQLISTVVTGTAPLQVSSSTMVPNLNASLLGGNAASAFALASGSNGYIQNGTALQPGGNFNISGNGTLGGGLSANLVNSAGGYQIGGAALLSATPFANGVGGSVSLGLGAGNANSAQNVFIGVNAGASNTTGDLNVFTGYAAGMANNTGQGNSLYGYGAGAVNTTGTFNTFIGVEAGASNVDGNQNVFVGSNAGAHSNGLANTFLGSSAGVNTSTGFENTFAGSSSGALNTAGHANTFLGASAGLNNTTGNYNLFSGYRTGVANTSGSFNAFIGNQSGVYNTTGNNDIYIGSLGPISGSESRAIRIGGDLGTGYGPQTSAYIAGISGAATNAGVPVFVDATGKLGTSGGSIGGVTSFNGRTGAVVPAANDYSFPQIAGTLSFLRLSGMLGNSQLSGTYTNPLTLNNTSNSFTGSFTGNGAGLTSVPVSAGSSNYIQNGTALQAANFNISGNGSANSFNSSTTYQIGGSSVLSIGSSPDLNLFLGVGTGTSNIKGQGTSNTFVGAAAGQSNTNGNYNTFVGNSSGQSNATGTNNSFFGIAAGYFNTSGYFNSFFGAQAGFQNTTGYHNSFFGAGAGSGNLSGDSNAFFGDSSGYSNASGSGNSFYGYNSGYYNSGGQGNAFFGDGSGMWNTTGGYNTAIGGGAGNNGGMPVVNSGSYNVLVGSLAGSNIQTGSGNVFLGFEAGDGASTGSNNVYVGYQAGIGNSTGSSNIYISSYFPGGENNTIRIGTQGTGIGEQNVTYIAGIYGSTASGGIPVNISSSGQLGTLTSSRRFKEQIRDMGDRTSGLMKLRPVTFLYKPEYDKGPRTLQYGLIAEEVAEVYPDLVAYEPDGKPYTVKYQYLTTMLLNEMQKQYHRAEAQAEVIKTQQQEIDGLKAELRLQNAAFQKRLSRLESMVGTQTQIAAELPQR